MTKLSIITNFFSFFSFYNVITHFTKLFLHIIMYYYIIIRSFLRHY